MANALTKIKSGAIGADAIDSSDFAAASIDNEHLADNAVGLAEMAGGTDGQVITYDANGDPVAVGPGTDGQVLTSTGAGSPPAFETLPTSGAALANDANNRVVTADGSGGLNGEANLIFDGTNLDLGDSKEIRLGTGNDLEIYHDGTNSNIKNSTGVLYSRGSDVRITNAGATETMVKAVADGTVELYFDNTKKLNTSTNGVEVTRLGIGDDASSSHPLYVKHNQQYVAGIHNTASHASYYPWLLHKTINSKQAFGIHINGLAGDPFHVDQDGAIYLGGETAAANALDDYEEGYFTFTMDSENGDAWTSRAGYTQMRYVKIGNQVTFSGKYETNSSSGTPSGRLQITGLPFTSIAATSDSSNTRAFHGYVRGMSSDDNMVMHLWWLGAGSTTLLLHSFSNDYNGDMQSFAVAQLNSSTVWEGDVTGTYFTA